MILPFAHFFIFYLFIPLNTPVESMNGSKENWKWLTDDGLPFLYVRTPPGGCLCVDEHLNEVQKYTMILQARLFSPYHSF